MGSTDPKILDNKRVGPQMVALTAKSWTIDGSIWRFGAKGSINWNSLPNIPHISGTLEGEDFYHWFAHLMKPVQRLVEHLAKESSAKTVIRTAQYIKYLAVWMLRQPAPVKAFRDLTEYDFERFVSHLKQRPHNNKEKSRLSKGALASCFEAINKMYRWREVIGDGIQFPPFGDYSAERFAGRKTSDRPGTRTKLIPETDHQRLFMAALEFIRSQGAQVVAQLNQFPWKTTLTQTEKKGNIVPINLKLSNYDHVRAALDRFDQGICLHL
ncbi:MAG TPA: hypothetical protein PKE58_15815, partial [Acidobacteriota bacterium]|nr:hypothetical protein [Acidobacteriota bacterium]